MKMANKYLVLILGGSLIASCADLDTIPEGGTFTNEQKQQVVEMMPERLQADVTGMFSQISASYKVIFTSARDDDFGYPAVCLSQDLNGPDMVSTNSDYNWFSTCSDFLIVAIHMPIRIYVGLCFTTRSSRQMTS